MLLEPIHPKEVIEYDYVIIDPNLNAQYFYDVEAQLKSLAPDYAKNVQHVFPYLLRLNSVDASLVDEIKQHDQNQIKAGLSPFFLMTFKSVPTREPDIVDHLKQNLVYEVGTKKYLYRFFDPKIWMLLNYFESQDFLWINKYFKNIEFNFLNETLCFDAGSEGDFIQQPDHDLLDKISVNNRVFEKLKFKTDDLPAYFLKVSQIFNYADLIKNKGILTKDDAVASIFHADLIGESFLETHFFQRLTESPKGYEQASKQLSTSEWDDFFKKQNIDDENLKNKVMYDY